MTHQVTIFVCDDDKFAIQHATVHAKDASGQIMKGETGADGMWRHEMADGTCEVTATAFGLSRTDRFEVGTAHMPFKVDVQVDLQVQTYAFRRHARALCSEIEEGETVIVVVQCNSGIQKDAKLVVAPSQGVIIPTKGEHDAVPYKQEVFFGTDGAGGALEIEASLEHGATKITRRHDVFIVPAAKQSLARDVSVTMRRAGTDITDDLSLWISIRKSAEAMSFNNYQQFMDAVLCGIPHAGVSTKSPEFDMLKKQRFLPFTDTDAYRLLKVATEAFVMVNCGVRVEWTKEGALLFETEDAEYAARRIGVRPRNLEELWNNYLVELNGTQDATLPYFALIRAKLADLRIKTTLFGDGGATAQGEACFGLLRRKLTHPIFTELIWSYWHEEGMLVQTMNAIARRFQNIRSLHPNDPLANLEIDPLRPLNSLLWGYIQDEQHRLSIGRRAYEYQHEYALTLDGKAVGTIRPADARSRFLEAFHQLLHECAQFYGHDDNTTVVADGFPVLNALKEVHLILSEGAGNQFGGVPTTARIEMLTQLWLLARPEFREYLPTRIMVAYPECWMDRVDAMKKLQGWTDTSVLHFSNLGGFGEKILLSIRYGAWSGVNDATQAANWVRYWRPEIQGYIHAYRSVTGADLTAVRVGQRIEASLPSVLLREQLVQQKRRIA